MRSELKGLEERFWGVNKHDFETTSALVKSFMKAYWKDLELHNDSKIVPEKDLYIAQHYRETQLLIQFGIWRLQSIFERLLKDEFDIKTFGGIRKIVNDLKSKGYTLIKQTDLF